MQLCWKQRRRVTWHECRSSLHHRTSTAETLRVATPRHFILLVWSYLLFWRWRLIYLMFSVGWSGKCEQNSDDGPVNNFFLPTVRIGWNKFRQLVPLLTNKDVSLIMRGRLYSSCVRSSMLHGSETWPVRKENEVALQWAEMRMVRWMRGVKLKDRLPSKELRERLGIDDIASVLQQNRLQCYRHVLRKDDDWVKNACSMK